ncbi:hypothetical protein ACFOM8_06080 [Paracoccus angustae]|uniref:Uncharacterized protein n=1 Tax=Paracoccus angustae TaxID=1671480 RepID=A0ABV7U1Q9_9RHOB
MQGDDLGGWRPVQKFPGSLNVGPDRTYLAVKKRGIDASIDQVHLQPVQLALRRSQRPFSLGPGLRGIACLGLHRFQP